MGKGERKGLNVGGVGEWGKKGVGVMGIQRLHSRDGRGLKHFVFRLHLARFLQQTMLRSFASSCLGMGRFKRGPNFGTR